MLGNPMEIAALVGVAVLLFGADKLPKLARSAGEMRKEFHRGQTEADAARESEAAAAATGSAAATPETTPAPSTEILPPNR